MDKRNDNLFHFLVRYSPYGMVPLAWFAYIAGSSPWLGAAAGLVLTLLVGVPQRLERLASTRPRVSRRP
ncbi:hypothetical protein F3N42_07315 [Marinihelvus fidelis]|uniref:Uncharacterized protein n=1 Tax=Marinihelvus fidelis TaxID=2613842 RepID=A0A5N0TC33_9GAMM|nr:hypothetical protein [Marinihelvus fidelis]KAA9131974.1 hypothetical protein F3N42_07315 [Marinihelvus fidelis]